MLFNSFKERIADRKTFYIIIAAANICFIALLSTIFFSTKGIISAQQAQSAQAVSTTAEKNIRQTVDRIYIFGSTLSENVPAIFGSAEGYQLNMSAHLKEFEFICDIVYISDTGAYSCGSLLKPELAKINGAEANAPCFTLNIGNKRLILFAHTVYGENQSENGSLYLVFDREGFEKKFNNSFYTVSMYCNENLIINREKSNNNNIKASVNNLPYSLSAEIDIPKASESHSALIAAIALIFLAVLLDCYLINYLKLQNGRLTALRNQIVSFQEGDYKPLSPGNIKEKEFRQLISAVDLLEKHSEELTKQLNNYKKTVYDQELAQSKLKYFALKNQMNPHFLYNTLACIKSIAICNRQNEIADISSCMAKILKYNLSSENTATVEQEVAMIEAYLYIQSVRYYNLFSYSVCVDDSVKSLPIMRFFLQPIVENAVIHGFSNNSIKGTITIRGYRKDDCLIFKIEDTGIGIPPNILVQINNDLENSVIKLKGASSETTNGIGLANINSRIALFYGENYGLTVNSAVNTGTIVTAKIPIDKKDNLTESEG